MVQQFSRQNPSGLMIEVNASTDHHFEKRHENEMEQVLVHLAERLPSQIVVCTGLSGSPLDVVDHILADLVDARNFYAFSRALGEYKGVFSVDIGTIRAQV